MLKLIIYLVVASWLYGKLEEFSQKASRRAPKPKRSGYERYWAYFDSDSEASRVDRR